MRPFALWIRRLSALGAVPPKERLRLLGLGSLCFVLGVIGIIFPVVPGLPFLGLSLICFLRASGGEERWPQLRQWRRRVFAAFANYRKSPIEAKRKLWTIFLAGAVVFALATLSILLVVWHYWLRG